MSCLIQDYHYEAEISSLAHNFSHSFASDGDYTCKVEMFNALITSDFEKEFTFKVQYALENLYLVLWEPDSINYGVLRPPTFSKEMYFVLQADKDQPLATNTSWSIDYGNSVTEASDGVFIAVTDNDTQYETETRDHVYTWMLNFEQAGDWTVTIKLWNAISNMSLDYTYRVYEEITELDLQEIRFLV